MKTYSEKQGNKPFNWREALMDPGADSFKLSKLAKSWITCACGNQCNIIPRDKHGIPEDRLLADLGSIFTSCIRRGNYKEALKTLTLIEARSAKLIAKITPDRV